jgi:hypothetical protein
MIDDAPINRNEPVPDPESSLQDGDTRLQFEERYRIPPGRRLVTRR